MGIRSIIFLAAINVNAAVFTQQTWAQNPQEGGKLYSTYCATCHGEKGKGDGVAARSLPIKPADHTNGAVMNQFSDKFLMEIISKGGSAVGKSSFMPAWGSSLNDKQVLDVISYLRSIADSPYRATEK